LGSSPASPLGEPLRHEEAVASAAFSPDGHKIVTASGELAGKGEARVWDADSGKPQVMRHYWATACSACPLKEQCTRAKERSIERWEHEAVLEAAQDRLDRKPDTMTVRRSTAEHPFGTIKFWMGSAHFLMKKLGKVRTEMALHVLSYNMKRVMKILGVPGLLQVMRA